jgi:hypothetical protein
MRSRDFCSSAMYLSSTTKGLTATRHASRNPSGEEADWLLSRLGVEQNTNFGASYAGHQAHKPGQPTDSAQLQTLTNPQVSREDSPMGDRGLARRQSAPRSPYLPIYSFNVTIGNWLEQLRRPCQFPIPICWANVSRFQALRLSTAQPILHASLRRSGCGGTDLPLSLHQ